MIRAATIVSGAFVISRLLGFVRVAIIAGYYGATSPEVNAYQLASRIPDTIFFVVAGGALGSAFIPTFTGYFARDDSAGGWRLFSAVLNLIFIAVAALCGLAALFAHPLLLLWLPALADQPQLLDMTAVLLRILLLSTLIFSLSGLFMGALNARQHFVLPAIAPLVYNLGIIGGTVLFAPDTPADGWPHILGPAWGAVAGAAGHLLIQVPGLRRYGARYTPILSLRHRGVQQVLRLMAPRVLGLSFSQINNLIIPVLVGRDLLVIAALDFAWRIVLMPQSILGQALGIAAFPTFADLAARMQLPEMRRILAATLRLLLFLLLPATILLMALSQPLVALAFERGGFDAVDTTLTAWALLFYAPGLVALAGLEVVSRAFYAMEDTHTPVIAGALQLAGMAALGYFFSQWLFPALDWPPLGGLALAVSLSNLVEMALLLELLRRRMGGIDGRHLWDGFWRIAAAGFLMAVASWMTASVTTGTGALARVTFGSLVGGCVYLSAGWGLKIGELHQLLVYVRRRFRR